MPAAVGCRRRTLPGCGLRGGGAVNAVSAAGAVSAVSAADTLSAAGAVSAAGTGGGARRRRGCYFMIRRAAARSILFACTHAARSG